MLPKRLKEIRERQAAGKASALSVTLKELNEREQLLIDDDHLEHSFQRRLITSMRASWEMNIQAQRDMGDLLDIVDHVYETCGPGAAMIALERKAHTEREGWTPEHDDEHADGELAKAAAVYATASWFPRNAVEAKLENLNAPVGWPWHWNWWKPGTPIQMLVKAGALIAAEIDRRIRRGESAE